MLKRGRTVKVAKSKRFYSDPVICKGCGSVVINSRSLFMKNTGSNQIKDMEWLVCPNCSGGSKFRFSATLH